MTEIGALVIVCTKDVLRTAACSDGIPAGALFCNCSATCVPGEIADPLVGKSIVPLTPPPVGNATGTGAGVCPCGTGVAGAIVATACVWNGVCDGIGTGVVVGAGVGVELPPEGVTPPPPPHPTAPTHNAEIKAIKTNACLKSDLLAHAIVMQPRTIRGHHT